MPEPPEIPDGENAARLWLSQCPGVVSLVGSRIYFELPRQDAPELPAVEVAQMGGRPDDKAHVTVLLGFTAHGATKHAASQVAQQISRYLSAEDPYPVAVGDDVIVGAGCDGMTQIPGTDTAKRYSVTGWLVVRKEAP